MSEGSFDLYRRKIPPEIIGLIPDSIARESLAIALGLVDGYLVVALADPDDRETVRKLEFILGRQVRIVQASRHALQYAITRYYAD